ncbi:MAG: hypothetical protein JWO94_3996 [Verrucomicrobiaceae bacterium]|nr:hypothetical protein [Verrucomicrobiaceae bacterium]
MLFNIIVVILLALSIITEEFLPAIDIAQNARLFIGPVFFFAASVSVPFPVMLVMAFGTGFIWDARYLPFVTQDSGAEKLAGIAGDDGFTAFTTVFTSASDLGFGYSILFFGVLGALMQGIRPLFKKGRLELPVLMVGFVTATWLLGQYLLISFLRGSLYFPSEVWTKLVTDTLLAMLASPILFLMLHTLAKTTHYEIKYEGLRYRFDGR